MLIYISIIKITVNNKIAFIFIPIPEINTTPKIILKQNNMLTKQLVT
jgi:hypothetical protein